MQRILNKFPHVQFLSIILVEHNTAAFPAKKLPGHYGGSRRIFHRKLRFADVKNRLAGRWSVRRTFFVFFFLRNRFPRGGRPSVTRTLRRRASASGSVSALASAPGPCATHVPPDVTQQTGCSAREKRRTIRRGGRFSIVLTRDAQYDDRQQQLRRRTASPKTQKTRRRADGTPVPENASSAGRRTFFEA